MSGSGPLDFNAAQTQEAVLGLIPSGTLVKVRLFLRPGGAGPEGWLTQSRSSEALYLNTEAVILDGPYAKRRVYTRIGLKGRGTNTSDDLYASRGRALIRAILESARGVRAHDESEVAKAARSIASYADLNGLEFVARIGVDRDRAQPHDEGRNVIAAAIGPDHADYARLMAPAAASGEPAPAWAQPR